MLSLLLLDLALFGRFGIQLLQSGVDDLGLDAWLAASRDGGIRSVVVVVAVLDATIMVVLTIEDILELASVSSELLVLVGLLGFMDILQPAPEEYIKHLILRALLVNFETLLSRVDGVHRLLYG